MKIGIVGKINVGKSTLFNRLYGTFRIIVTEIGGTTRELIGEKIKLTDKITALLYDSPGLNNFADEMVYIQEIINKADILIFLVDVQENITSQDLEIKKLILQAQKFAQTILVINKMDNKIGTAFESNHLSEFANLGFNVMIPVSAKHNEGIENLKKNILDLSRQLNIKHDQFEEIEKDYIPISIVGRPNTGKSTLINSLIGEQIAKVDAQAGTTLDYISCQINYKNKKYKLYDTMGIRRQGKIHGLERIGFDKTITLLQYVKPVILILIDAQEGATHRDKTLINELVDLHLPIIIAINKIDIYNSHELKKNIQTLQNNLKIFRRIPIIDISGMKHLGLSNIFKFTELVYQNYQLRISTHQLNEVIQQNWINNPPRFPKNKFCKINYITQIEISPPTITVFINKKDNLNFAFKNWLENIIRKNFGFVGSPIIMKFKERCANKGVNLAGVSPVWNSD